MCCSDPAGAPDLNFRSAAAVRARCSIAAQSNVVSRYSLSGFDLADFVSTQTDNASLARTLYCVQREGRFESQCCKRSCTTRWSVLSAESTISQTMLHDFMWCHTPSWRRAAGTVLTCSAYAAHVVSNAGQLVDIADQQTRCMATGAHTSLQILPARQGPVQQPHAATQEAFCTCTHQATRMMPCSCTKH